MKITSAQAADMVLACCGCPRPECEAPRSECQILRGVARLDWQAGDGFDQFYRTRRIDYAGGGFLRYRSSSTYVCWFNPAFTGTVTGSEIQFSDGDPQTGTATESNSEPINIGSAYSSALADLRAAVDFENDDYAVETQTGWYTPPGSTTVVDSERGLFHNPGLFVASWCRYRFAVPEEFSTEEVTRSYYVMQWDVAFIPNPPPDPLPEGEVPPPPVLISSEEFEWGGDMEEPWSDWFDMPLQETGGEFDSEVGEVRIVNLMVKCYRCARLGVKPTVFGEVIVFEDEEEPPSL